jgi:hypothetical protein
MVRGFGRIEAVPFLIVVIYLLNSTRPDVRS